MSIESYTIKLVLTIFVRQTFPFCKYVGDKKVTK